MWDANCRGHKTVMMMSEYKHTQANTFTQTHTHRHTQRDTHVWHREKDTLTGETKGLNGMHNERRQTKIA